MKTHILIFLLFLAGISAPVSATAQSGKARISFDYNESGERISRKVIYLDTQEKTQIKEQKEEVRAAVTDVFSNKEVKIYPNPTRGILNIAISGMTGDETGSFHYQIYNNAGQLTFETDTFEAKTLLDFSRYPAGIYIVRISFNGNHKEYKIIKQ